jgi:pimeloyl-ACP methyl ester carboxylesterase
MSENRRASAAGTLPAPWSCGLGPARHTVRLVVTILLATVLSGCGTFIQWAMVDASNQGEELDPALDPLPEGLAGEITVRQFRVEVCPPPPLAPRRASLSVWVLDKPGSEHWVNGAPRATLLLLHGRNNDKSQMLPAAISCMERGYRTVLVDHRGFGRSTGDWLTYGVVESSDVRQVVDALGERGLLAGPIGAIGVSYGAAVAIQWAAVDDRAKAVVSMAAFTSLRDIVPHQVRLFLPVISWFLSDDFIQAQVTEACGKDAADIDPEAASPLQAIARTKAQVLLIHGTSDPLIPPEHATRLHENARDHSTLQIVDGVRHAALLKVFTGSSPEFVQYRDGLFAWLEDRLGLATVAPFGGH